MICFSGRRGRTTAIEGIYSNSHFVHSATMNVGSIVQVQTQSGCVYEGVYRTFSPHFQVALEMAHRVEPPSDVSSPAGLTANGAGGDHHHNTNSSSSNGATAPKIAVESVVEVLIFKPSDIVSIVAKDVDLEYATRDTLPTDTAISARCNGSMVWAEEKELEPWDSTNGDDISLELDGNSNGWDANDMFHKNETIYGVQSTFDHAMTGYTMQIQKKDTQDFK